MTGNKMKSIGRIALMSVGISALALGLPAFAQDGDVVLRLHVLDSDALVENFNPNNPTGPQQIVRDFVYEPLWIDNVWNPDEDYPALATSYEIAEDLMSITYKLREGVTWSDGEEFNADDVVFTFDYAKANQDYPMGIDVYMEETDTGSIVSVEKVDDYTVKFNLHEPDSLARYAIGGIYPLPEHIWADVEDPKNFANPDPVGTGPWTELANFSRSSVDFCRNETSRYNEENAIDCLRFLQLNGNEQIIASMSAGDVDWLGTGLTDPEITFKPQSEFNNYWLPPGGDVNLQINTTKPPFNNLEFRQAMSVAIDRDTIVDISTFGLTTHTRFPVGTGETYSTWFNEEALEPYTWLMRYDPDRAMELLDGAGFVDADGDGWRDNPDGTPIQFDINIPNGWTDWINTGQTISENLQDVGINASVRTMDQGAWNDQARTGDFDSYIMWTNGGPTPYNTYNPMFNPRNMEKGRVDYQAMHQMRLPEVEEALQAFRSTADRDEQMAHMNTIHTAIAENLPIIGLFANPTWYEYSTRNFQGWVTEENPFVRPTVHEGTRERVIHALALKPVSR
ncbi:ABC transporter substrate-binding protein [Devosia sp. RR2S18]|uniref:ABC transporter substrate-binding protein n=1 Tax=Devosia rhizosphaerae TaxID=3049774 RepID=UPI002541B5F0|nr:ABC transporter substrate-binding protein [Devosia sp. RR2S18]WIJ24242.1 ABC transporter substrate-binding protein [Devosia sp. RR2S18]